MRNSKPIAKQNGIGMAHGAAFGQPTSVGGFARPASLSTAPSVRVPVTPANREYLRRLRRAELAAWLDGSARDYCPELRAKVP